MIENFENSTIIWVLGALGRRRMWLAQEISPKLQGRRSLCVSHMSKLWALAVTGWLIILLPVCVIHMLITYFYSSVRA